MYFKVHCAVCLEYFARKKKLIHAVQLTAIEIDYPALRMQLGCWMVIVDFDVMA